MLVNYLRGDMKLVGVRTTQQTLFLNFTEKRVQERRIKYKPGLVPPFYADMPADLEAIQASELNYSRSF